MEPEESVAVFDASDEPTPATVIAFPGKRGGKMPFIVEEIAPQNETKQKVLDVLNGQVDLVYFRNRITLEGNIGEDRFDENGEPLDNDEIAQLGVARRLCRLCKSWDVQGPIYNSKGEEKVGPGEVVPFDPQIVRLLPMRVLRGINQAIYGEELGGNDDSRPKQ